MGKEKGTGVYIVQNLDFDIFLDYFHTLKDMVLGRKALNVVNNIGGYHPPVLTPLTWRKWRKTSAMVSLKIKHGTLVVKQIDKSVNFNLISSVSFMKVFVLYCLSPWSVFPSICIAPHYLQLTRVITMSYPPPLCY